MPTNTSIFQVATDSNEYRPVESDGTGFPSPFAKSDTESGAPRAEKARTHAPEREDLATDKADPDSTPTRVSPFRVVDEEADGEKKAIRPAKLPEKRKARSPFQIAEGADANGIYPQGHAASQFQAAQPGTGFPSMPMEFAGAFANGVYPGFPPTFQQSMMFPSASPVDMLASRQLELRAIFGVDRPMSMDEIVQHCRQLGGVKNLTFLTGREASAIDTLFHVFQRLGLAGAELRVHAGETPLELIREGPVIVVVESDGPFPSGVRETLAIVAREIAKML